MIFYALSDVGRFRSRNEDAYLSSGNPIGPLDNLFVVADGMGGAKAGEFASFHAIEALKDDLVQSGIEDPFEALKHALGVSNTKLYNEAMRDPAKRGMGTTIVCATVKDGHLIVVNVGDSRLYLESAGKLMQITTDHSYVEELVNKGIITREEARSHKDKNKITRALGVMPQVKADFFDVFLTGEESFLLCTDGLTNMVLDDEIHRVMISGGDVAGKATNLIDMANAAGGKDNITLIIVEPFAQGNM